MVDEPANDANAAVVGAAVLGSAAIVAGAWQVVRGQLRRSARGRHGRTHPHNKTRRERSRSGGDGGNGVVAAVTESDGDGVYGLPMPRESPDSGNDIHRVLMVEANIRSEFLQLVREGKEREVEALLNLHPELIHFTSEGSSWRDRNCTVKPCNALVLAVLNRQTSMVELLVARSTPADVNYRTNIVFDDGFVIRGHTPLMLCIAVWPRPTRREANVRGPPYPEVDGSHDNARADFAASKGELWKGGRSRGALGVDDAGDGDGVDVASLLIRHGADVHATDSRGQTPLMLTTLKGDVPMAKLLLDSGAYAHTCTKEGETALSCAEWRGNKEIMSLLISRGPGANGKGV